jgi:thioredoxin 1
MVLEISKESNLFALFEQKLDMIIMVSASWCNPCKLIKPEFHMFSTIYKNITFVYIDVNKYKDESKQFIDRNVSALPTFLFCKNKNIVSKIEGGNKQMLEDFINNNNTVGNNKQTVENFNNNNNNELNNYWNMSNNIIN